MFLANPRAYRNESAQGPELQPLANAAQPANMHPIYSVLVKRLSKVTAGILLVLSSIVSFSAGSADGIDIHRLWDDRCIECHGHAAQFSRQALTVSDGELQGRHHTDDLRIFMQSHYLNMELNEVDLFYNMLLAQASTEPRFEQQCSDCHGSVADFVRESLELCNGVVCRSDSGRPVRSFLDSHRNLEQEEVDFYMDLLTRVAHEVF